VDQADDALGQSRSVVGLDAGWVEPGAAPTGREQLFDGGWVLERSTELRYAVGWCRRADRARQDVAAKAAEHDEHRHRTLGPRRSHERHANIDPDRRAGRVIDV